APRTSMSHSISAEPLYDAAVGAGALSAAAAAGAGAGDACCALPPAFASPCALPSAGASALPASADAASAASTCRMTVPSATLSPTLTCTDFTTPPADAGISMDALSDSTVIRLCSALIVSPAATSTSMT